MHRPDPSVLERLEARRSGASWIALCPAHDDKNPSLSITEKDGKILLHCHAGCSYEAILAAAGISPSELFSTDGARSREVATYDYTDEAAKVLYQVVRSEPKAFKQRKPDGRGGWTWSLNGIRRVLYRLPEVLGGTTVLIVEGEKDVETARACGFVATCNPGGAGKWRPEYSESLRGKDVVIIPDQDEPGRKHAEQVARAVHRIAARVRILNLPEPLKDLSEWQLSTDALKQLIEEAPDWTPEEVTKAEIGGKLASEVEPENVAWLWEGRILRGKLNVLDGDPGNGKSTVTIDLAARLSRGLPMPSASDAVAAGTVFITSEDAAADTIVPRLMAAGADLARIHLYALDTVSVDGAWPSIPDGLEALESAIRRVNAQLVVVDPFVAFLDREYDTYRDQDVRAAFAKRLDVAVVLIRHLNKSNSGNAIYRGGGTVGIIGAARAGLLAAIDPQDPAVRVLAVTKGNLAAPAGSLRYRIVEKLIPWKEATIKTSAIEWIGESSYQANELLAPSCGEELSGEEEAMEFLRGILEDGAVSTKRIFTEARKQDICTKTLRRAAKRLGVAKTKFGFGKEGGWNWDLTVKVAKEEPKLADQEKLATLKQVIEIKPFNSNTSFKMSKNFGMAILEPDLPTYESHSDGNPHSE